MAQRSGLFSLPRFIGYNHPMPNACASVQVVPRYQEFKSRIDYAGTVEFLLRYVPVKYLAGLNCVLLRDSGGLTRSEKLRAGKKRRAILGHYCRATHGQQAQIHLFVDQIARYWPTPLLWWRRSREYALADVLFHEIGHHIHAHIAPEYRDRELTAEDWRGRLILEYLRRRYWYLRPLRKPIGLILRRLRSLVRTHW